jgi:hypothetical protein
MKNIAWGIIIFFNLFFLYYMMTLALTRARDFQVSFAIACVVELMFEIFIFETLEVAWVQYMIPHLVVNDVRKRIVYFRQQINDAFDVKLSEIEHPFDATEYLFVSARLAKEFPTLFESEIILIFSNYLPGAIGDRWGNVKSWRPSNMKGASFTILLPMLTVLQWMGTFSMRAQKAIMHVFQPIFCAMGVVLAFFMAANPIWLLVPAAFICFEVYQWSKRRRKAKVALIGGDVDLDAKMEEPLKAKPEPEGAQLTDIDDRPVKAKPIEECVKISPTVTSVVAIEEPVLVPPVETVESTEKEEEVLQLAVKEEEPKIVSQQSVKKKKAFANYEMQEEQEEKTPVKDDRAETVATSLENPVPPVPDLLLSDDDDDDARTVYDDDGTPSGVEKVEKKQGGRGRGGGERGGKDTTARKKNRQHRRKAQQLFEQFENRRQEDLITSLLDDGAVEINPKQKQNKQHGKISLAFDELVASPYAAYLGQRDSRDVRAGRVHLPPVARKGGPGIGSTGSTGTGSRPNRFSCLDSGHDQDSGSDEDGDAAQKRSDEAEENNNIPKLNWEK